MENEFVITDGPQKGFVCALDTASDNNDADSVSETINVVYTVDVQHGGAAQFCDQLIASITSIRTSKREQARVNVVVLYANLPTSVAVTLMRLQSPPFTVSLNPIGQQDLQYLQQFTKYQPQGMMRTWNGIVFARLYIARFQPNLAKCVYLDSDTLVRRSLHELWRTDLQGKMFGMNFGVVPEYGFNSGVMVMDLNKIRNTEGIWQKLEAFMRQYAKEFFLPDQTVINRFFAPEITPIDRKWNYCPTPGNSDIRGADAAAIWHFYNQTQKPVRFDEVGQTLVAWNNTFTRSIRDWFLTFTGRKIVRSVEVLMDAGKKIGTGLNPATTKGSTGNAYTPDDREQDQMWCSGSFDRANSFGPRRMRNLGRSDNNAFVVIWRNLGSGNNFAIEFGTSANYRFQIYQVDIQVQ